MIVQQGDVILTKIEKLPVGTKLIKGNVLHKGDNHSHLVSGRFTLRIKDNDVFIIVKDKCVLDHDEHGKSNKKYRTLEKGVYKKSIVMEYDHMLEESRRVID